MTGSLAKVASGKVREIYDAGPGLLLMVTSDRISAYDVVLEDPIPDKGKVLTAMTLFWTPQIDSIVATHLVTSDPGRFPPGALELGDLAGRAVLVRRAEMLPLEFIVRGYLFGSAWAEYAATGSLWGRPMPVGMKPAEKLPEPLMTVTTKSEEGHDLPITIDDAAALCGTDTLRKVEAAALSVYAKADDLAAGRGLVIADTKFEFGLIDGDLVLADEILTPDSSRYWPAEELRPGESPPSFDKQFLRDYLDSSGWDHSPPAPRLPTEIVDATRGRYVEAYERLTGRSFEDYVESF